LGGRGSINFHCSSVSSGMPSSWQKFNRAYCLTHKYLI
jgi:hypothetical protein